VISVTDDVGDSFHSADFNLVGRNLVQLQMRANLVDDKRNQEDLIETALETEAKPNSRGTFPVVGHELEGPAEQRVQCSEDFVVIGQAS
jgi:hypothetical protein